MRSDSCIPHYKAAPRVIAAIAFRWPEIARLGYFDDFGIVARESAVQYDLEASASLNNPLGFELKIEKSGWVRVNRTRGFELILESLAFSRLFAALKKSALLIRDSQKREAGNLCVRAAR